MQLGTVDPCDLMLSSLLSRAGDPRIPAVRGMNVPPDELERAKTAFVIKQAQLESTFADLPQFLQSNLRVGTSVPTLKNIFKEMFSQENIA